MDQGAQKVLLCYNKGWQTTERALKVERGTIFNGTLIDLKYII